MNFYSHNDDMSPDMSESKSSKMDGVTPTTPALIVSTDGGNNNQATT